MAMGSAPLPDPTSGALIPPIMNWVMPISADAAPALSA
jgi:hypothetical protein